jgi:nucleotidyltransferase substrate binding protein (TIGR01987 family)
MKIGDPSKRDIAESPVPPTGERCIVTENKLDYSSLENAIATLAVAIGSFETTKVSIPAEQRDIMRDGVIQRFEYTFELAWKTIKRYLEMYGLEKVDKLSNRDLFRVAFESGLIQDPVRWFGFLTDRNQTSHIYDQNVAADVFESAEAFLSDAQYLLAQLKARVK